MAKTGEMLNMFNPLDPGPMFNQNVLKTGEMFNMFNMFVQSWGKTLKPPHISPKQWTYWTFPLFKHILIEHKPKGLNILSISPVLATLWALNYK